MLRDITIGQYYSADSVIHSLDPRVKLFGVLLFIISLFTFGNIFSYCLATIILIVVITVSKIPFKYVIRGLKPLLILLLFTTVLNLFTTKGEVLIHIWKLSITKEGIFLAVHIFVRLMYLIIASSLLTLTTTPTRLTDAMEKVMRPLNKINVPVHEVAMMMSIALRFIPILVDETDKIMKAQSARCMDFEHGNVIKRLKNLVPLLIPLFISAIRRANDLALAMEARFYQGGEGRTKMRELKYVKTDYIAYGFICMYFAVSFGLNFIQI